MRAIGRELVYRYRVESKEGGRDTPEPEAAPLRSPRLAVTWCAHTKWLPFSSCIKKNVFSINSTPKQSKCERCILVHCSGYLIFAIYFSGLPFSCYKSVRKKKNWRRITHRIRNPKKKKIFFF